MGCNRQLNKSEELVENSAIADATSESNKSKQLWEGIVNKVWINETWSGSEAYEDMSFVITSVQQGKLEGQFLEKGILAADVSLYSKKQHNNMVLAGNYNEYGAELTLEGGKNIKGKLYISLEKEDLLHVEIQYIGQKTKNTFRFKSYNLKDLEADIRAEFDSDIKDITLIKWGKIKFASVVRTSSKRKTLFIYLVDDKKNILYDFAGSMAFPNDFKVNDFLFKDINDDGREDLLLILEGITDIELHEIIIYEQNEMGGFEVNVKKSTIINNKMNESKKYNIRDIIEYLR
jgi:hypothetical protein